MVPAAGPGSSYGRRSWSMTALPTKNRTNSTASIPSISALLVVDDHRKGD
jgi:hypothetical protein